MASFVETRSVSGVSYAIEHTKSNTIEKAHILYKNVIPLSPEEEALGLDQLILRYKAGIAFNAPVKNVRLKVPS